MPSPPPPGLCGRCRHARQTGNRRGSVFLLCGLAAHDPRFRKYPPLPVLSCPGFAPDTDTGTGTDTDTDAEEPDTHR